jgi:hypothetical protein
MFARRFRCERLCQGTTFIRLLAWVGESWRIAILENGDLLDAAEEAGFELLIICDKNMRHQQNLDGRKFRILELWTNHRPTLELHWDYIRQHAESVKPGEYRILEKP